MQKQAVHFEELGAVDYKTAWDYQESLLQKNLAIKKSSSEVMAGLSSGETKHYLLFVEHHPVYTLGKSGKIENVLLTEAQRQERGIEFFYTNRGGDITYHGPGQLVGYPIFDLEKFYTDIGRYLRELEEVIIQTLAVYGIRGERSKGETGVWLDAGVPGRERKICAMGVRCSRWITMHGFALNVNTDLAYFEGIIPCGIQNKKVTSMAAELGHKVDIEGVKARVLQGFEEVFSLEILPAYAVAK